MISFLYFFVCASIAHYVPIIFTVYLNMFIKRYVFRLTLSLTTNGNRHRYLPFRILSENHLFCQTRYDGSTLSRVVYTTFYGFRFPYVFSFFVIDFFYCLTKKFPRFELSVHFS